MARRSFASPRSGEVGARSAPGGESQPSRVGRSFASPLVGRSARVARRVGNRNLLASYGAPSKQFDSRYLLGVGSPHPPGLVRLPTRLRPPPARSRPPPALVRPC